WLDSPGREASLRQPHHQAGAGRRVRSGQHADDRVGGDKNKIEHDGFYEDTYVKTPQGWRFGSRVHHATYNAGGGGGNRGGGRGGQNATPPAPAAPPAPAQK